MEACQGWSDNARARSFVGQFWSEQNCGSYTGACESVCCPITTSAHGENGIERTETGSAEGSTTNDRDGNEWLRTI